MKILICGSRDWPDENAIRDRISLLPEGTTIISGGARGADSMAEFWAKEFGYKSIVIHADWAQNGKRAGIIRNIEMLNLKPDLVIAFPLRQSRGTTHTINTARLRGIEVEINELHV